MSLNCTTPTECRIRTVTTNTNDRPTGDGEIKRTGVRRSLARQVFVCTLSFARRNGTKAAPRDVRVVPRQTVSLFLSRCRMVAAAACAAVSSAVSTLSQVFPRLAQKQG
jgi:hypothetical protein